MIVVGAEELCTVEFILFYSVRCSQCSSTFGSRDPPDAISSASVSGWTSKD